MAPRLNLDRTGLIKERSKLFAHLRQLEAERDALNLRTLEASVEAIRAGGEDQIADTDLLTLQRLEQRIKVASMAIEGVDSDLAELDERLEHATRARQKAEIRSVLDEFIGTCEALDRDVLDADKWRLLVELGQTLNQRCNRFGGKWSIQPYPTARDLGIFFKMRGQEIEQCLKQPRQPAATVTRVSQWFKVDHMRADVESWLEATD